MFRNLLASARCLQGSRPAALAVLGLIALSIGIRLALCFELRPALVEDAWDYHDFATHLLAGRGFQHTHHGVDPPFTFRAYRPPGYPAALAVLYASIGVLPRAAMMMNVFADLLTQLACVLIAVRCVGRWGAVVTAFLLLLHVTWTPSLTTESLYSALFAVLALLLVHAGTPLRKREALGLGLALALAVAVRPTAMLAAPVLMVAALRGRSSWGRRALLVVLTGLPLVLALGAWGARNHALFGQVVLTTTNLGDHNAPDFGIHPERTFARLRSQGLDEAGIHRAFVALVVQQIRRDPGAFLSLWARRSADLLSLEPAWELDKVLYRFSAGAGDGVEDGDTWLRRAYRRSHEQYGFGYVLAVTGGLVALWHRRRVGFVWALIVVVFVAHGALSRGDMRLAAPLYPLLCVLAGGWTLLGSRGAPSASGSGPADERLSRVEPRARPPGPARAGRRDRAAGARPGIPGRASAPRGARS